MMGDEIRFKYLQPRQAGAFHALLGFAKNNKITHESASKHLSNLEAVYLHASKSNSKPRRRVICKGMNDQWHADLIDLQKYKKQNNNFQYILTIIDCFSKVAEARPLKNKCGTVVARAFEEVLKETRTHPLKLQVDMGKEFYSAPFQEIYKKYNIHMFSVFSEIKNSICERFNRTLMDKIARYWTYSNSFKYVDVLPDIISNYNNSFHRSIGRVPLKVTKENEQEIENSILNYRLTRRNQSFKSMILFEFHVIKICSQKDITKIGQKNVSE